MSAGTAPGRDLRIGVLSFAHVHAGGYLRHLLAADGVEVRSTDPGGVAGPGEPPRGAEFAAALGAPYVDTLDELLAWRPDAVVVCTENAGHLEAVRTIAAAGAHVLCEKPLATTAADGDEIVRLVGEAGVLLMTAYPIRFTTAFASLAGRVRAGEIGEVLAVLGTNNGKIPFRDRAWFGDPDLAGGGALVDHVVHCADLLDALLGEAPASVRARSNAILHADLAPRVETGGIVTLTYPSGVVASIDCSWSQPGSAAVWGDVTLEVVGTRGSLTMRANGRAVSGADASGGVWLPIASDYDGDMIDAFLDAVRRGEQPQPDAHAGARTTRIVDAARESARTGATVRLP